MSVYELAHVAELAAMFGHGEVLFLITGGGWMVGKKTHPRGAGYKKTRLTNGGYDNQIWECLRL